MKMKYGMYIVVFLFLGRVASAIPSNITYQGALKDRGVPANGTRQMLFRITNEKGTQVYWSSGNMTVSVHNGLFSAQMNPVGVDWETVTPYIEVSVEGQQLLPREPVNTTVYATVSKDVIDGAVTPAKVRSGYGLVPSGMIALFSGNCPSGWIRFSELDGRFPRGASTAALGGASGGSESHDHGGDTGIPSDLRRDGKAGGGDHEPTTRHSHAISSASHLPPYVEVVYCEKT